MEDSGVFYTGTMHPLYEEIPTPMSGGTTASHYAVSGEYQLLNSDYSTLPYSEATLPYSESIPFLQNNMISVRTNNQQNQRNLQNNGGGFYPKSNGHTKNTSKNGGKFSAQKTLPPIIKSGPFFGGALNFVILQRTMPCFSRRRAITTVSGAAVAAGQLPPMAAACRPWILSDTYLPIYHPTQRLKNPTFSAGVNRRATKYRTPNRRYTLKTAPPLEIKTTFCRAKRGPISLGQMTGCAMPVL